MKCSNRHVEDAGLKRLSGLGYGGIGYLRSALPNALFMGSPATPIEGAATGGGQ